MTQTVRNLPAMQPTLFLSQEDALEEGMATHSSGYSHSSILAWRIPWTEGPGGLQSTGSHKSQTRLSYETATKPLERQQNSPTYQEILSHRPSLTSVCVRLLAQSCPTPRVPWTAARQALLQTPGVFKEAPRQAGCSSRR